MFSRGNGVRSVESSFSCNVFVPAWTLFVVAATSSALGQGVRAVVGGTLIDGTGRAPVQNAVLLIRDGRIACAGSPAKCRPPRGVARFDAPGLWIIPRLT
jgi:hypothetical protein